MIIFYTRNLKLQWKNSSQGYIQGHHDRINEQCAEIEAETVR